MDWKIIVLCLFLFGCVAKKKAVDVQKTEIATFEDQSEDNSTQVNLGVRESFQGFETAEFAQLSSLFNFKFDGENEEDEFRLKIDRTDSGIELTAKGKGTALAETSSKFGVSKIETEFTAKYDSLINAFESHKKITESKIKQFEKSKEIDKKGIGVPTGIYIVAVVLGLIWILLMVFKKHLKLF